MARKTAIVGKECVACGTCAKVCPRGAIAVRDGVAAEVDAAACIGCGKCVAACPAGVIEVVESGRTGKPAPANPRRKHWYDHLYVVTPTYLALGFFNILFAWIGLLFFFAPLIVSIAGKGKLYCNSFCDRGQFLTLLGSKFHLSRNAPTPRWMRSKIFRYGFLAFFMAMFGNMLFVTWMVFAGAAELGTAVQLLWTFSLPWDWAYPVEVLPGVAQFAFGFYSIMLTSNLIGLVCMVLFKPRTWCVFCPMGTMTQLISRLRRGKALPQAACSSCAGCSADGGCALGSEPAAGAACAIGSESAAGAACATVSGGLCEAKEA